MIMVYPSSKNQSNNCKRACHTLETFVHDVWNILITYSKLLVLFVQFEINSQVRPLQDCQVLWDTHIFTMENILFTVGWNGLFVIEIFWSIGSTGSHLFTSIFICTHKPLFVVCSNVAISAKPIKYWWRSTKYRIPFSLYQPALYFGFELTIAKF